MARYIDADNADKLLEKLNIDADKLLEKLKSTSRYFDIKFDIEQAPTEEVQPIVRGKWIECDETIQCSNCGTTYIKHDNSIQYKRYCERCGAKMDGKEE